MPEREKSDLLHAGNLLISMFVTSVRARAWTALATSRTGVPPASGSITRLRAAPSPRARITEPRGAWRWSDSKWLPHAPGSQRLSKDPRHGLRDASVGGAGG